jgi:hypothetical protein
LNKNIERKEKKFKMINKIRFFKFNDEIIAKFENVPIPQINTTWCSIANKRIQDIDVDN